MSVTARHPLTKMELEIPEVLVSKYIEMGYLFEGDVASNENLAVDLKEVNLDQFSYPDLKQYAKTLGIEGKNVKRDVLLSQIQEARKALIGDIEKALAPNGDTENDEPDTDDANEDNPEGSQGELGNSQEY